MRRSGHADSRYRYFELWTRCVRKYRVKDDGVGFQLDAATERDGPDRFVERFKLLLSVRLGVPFSTQLLTPTPRHISQSSIH